MIGFLINFDYVISSNQNWLYQIDSLREVRVNENYRHWTYLQNIYSFMIKFENYTFRPSAWNAIPIHLHENGSIDWLVKFKVGKKRWFFLTFHIGIITKKKFVEEDRHKVGKQVKKLSPTKFQSWTGKLKNYFSS